MSRIHALICSSVAILFAILIILVTAWIYYGLPVLAQLTDSVTTYNSSNSIVGTFFYPWYRGDSHGYEGWSTGGHDPPYNWASNFIPYFGSSKFDPVHQLYDSDNMLVLKKQLTWFKEAGIQFAISSWDGINTTRDRTFSDIFKYYMQNGSKIYPGFKWSLLYEKLAYINLTTSQIIHDFDYIKLKYTSSPAYLKINGRPVIFVYNGNLSKAAFLHYKANWSMIRNNTHFYIMMRNDIQNRGKDMLKSIDGWYEYKPKTRYEEDYGYSAFVSPGFWKFDESPKLIRNTSAFENSVQKLAQSKVHFKLIETWNEWFEGSQVEPGQQISHNDTLNTNVPDARPYDDSNLKILGKYFSNHH